MRDLVLREALETMAGDSALRLRELIAAGEEVPYEVLEAGEGSALISYKPRTAAFIRDHAAALMEVDAFGSGCAALDAAGLSTPYLERMGVAVPPEDRRRAELAGVVFLCRLWQESTDFTLDDRRISATVEEVLELGEVNEGEIEIVVPLRGVQMLTSRLELAGVTIVRADTVDVPNEARASEGMGGAAWEPSFLACARIEAGDEDGSDVAARAVETFRRLVTTLRLFKPGGVSLGPHAWTRIGSDRWRRIATGSGRPRPGGYRLADTELGELSAFSQALASPSSPFSRAGADRGGFPSALARSVSRFESGTERHVVLEALNDYLLSLRFLLEGAGPAGLGLPMRVAALCAEPERREEVRAEVERAVALERELWSGEPAVRGEGTPAELVAHVEDLARAILKDASCGHLGSDLRATADEILLADGLAVGEGSGDHGGTAEWDIADEPADEDSVWDDAPEELLATEETQTIDPPEVEPTVARAQNLVFEYAEPRAVEAPEDEGADFDPRPVMAEPRQTHEPLRVADPEPEPVETRGEPQTDGPVADLIAASDEHRREVSDRVSFLFPPPETTEWSVREIGYDRNRRAGVSEASQAS